LAQKKGRFFKRPFISVFAPKLCKTYYFFFFFAAFFFGAFFTFSSF